MILDNRPYVVLNIAVSADGKTDTVARRGASISSPHDPQPTLKNTSWTTPEKILSAILYLCSDEALIMNGARIPLYGAD